MTAPLAAGPDGWLLDPDGAAVHPVEATAVVADVHLGYEWARGAGGDCVPAHSLAETIGKLERVIARAPAPLTRLVAAGDLVETPGPCPRTGRDVAALTRWLAARGIALVPLKGNHDPPSAGVAGSLVVAGWTVAHGDRPVVASRTITGHAHPALRHGGVNAPCFLIGPRSILLPAFSPNAAGVDLLALGLERHPDASSLRCLAASGGLILDFGPVPPLLRALRSGVTDPPAPGGRRIPGRESRPRPRPPRASPQPHGPSEG